MPQDGEGKGLLSATGTSAVLHSVPGLVIFASLLALPQGRASLSPVPAWLAEMGCQGLVVLGEGLRSAGMTGAVTISHQSYYSRKRKPCSPPVPCPELGCAPRPWWHRRLSRAVVWEGKQRKVRG